jgi:hypothetical protein
MNKFLPITPMLNKCADIEFTIRLIQFVNACVPFHPLLIKLVFKLPNFSHGDARYFSLGQQGRESFVFYGIKPTFRNLHLSIRG